MKYRIQVVIPFGKGKKVIEEFSGDGEDFKKQAFGYARRIADIYPSSQVILTCKSRMNEVKAEQKPITI